MVPTDFDDQILKSAFCYFERCVCFFKSYKSPSISDVCLPCVPSLEKALIMCSLDRRYSIQQNIFQGGFLSTHIIFSYSNVIFCVKYAAKKFCGRSFERSISYSKISGSSPYSFFFSDRPSLQQYRKLPVGDLHYYKGSLPVYSLTEFKQIQSTKGFLMISGGMEVN